MQPGGHGAGGERTKLGRAGQGVHPPARSPMLCELEPVMEEKSRWRVLGDQFSPYHHLLVRKSEEPENSNLEFDLPGHYKGAFVKVGHWEVLRFITRVYLDMYIWTSMYPLSPGLQMLAAVGNGLLVTFTPFSLLPSPC